MLNITALFENSAVPLDTMGIIFLGLGFVFMLAELKLPTSGAVGILGMLSMLLGTVLVSETVYAMGITPFTLWASVLTLCAAFAALFVWSFKVLKSAPTTGENLLVGKVAKVIAWDGTKGKVTIFGETWKAEGLEGVALGDEVEIAEIRDHHLYVTLKSN